MRGTLKYGVPAAAALGVGGYALSQGEDPGSAALAAGAGGLGAAAGLLGARGLAGKYNPALLMSAQKNLSDAENAAIEYALKSREGGVRQTAGNLAADITRSLNKAAFGTGMTNAGLPFPTQSVQRNIGKGVAAAVVPTAALTAGLGGVALGAVPGAMGVPGFQQGVPIDPESPGSSNTSNAKYGVSPYATTMQYR
jgi:hypothetical protein